MASEKQSLVDVICKASRELGGVLRENEFSETEDLPALCDEALSEIFSGGGRK